MADIYLVAEQGSPVVRRTDTGEVFGVRDAGLAHRLRILVNRDQLKGDDRG